MEMMMSVRATINSILYESQLEASLAIECNAHTKIRPEIFAGERVIEIAKNNKDWFAKRIIVKFFKRLGDLDMVHKAEEI
jgi:hypothetical protein